MAQHGRLFNGSYDFENQEKHQYEEFTSPYSGLVQVLKSDGLYQFAAKIRPLPLAHSRPIRFESDARDHPGAGWRSGASTCRLPMTSLPSRCLVPDQASRRLFPRRPTKSSWNELTRGPCLLISVSGQPQQSSGEPTLCQDAPSRLRVRRPAEFSSRLPQQHPRAELAARPAMESTAEFHTKLGPSFNQHLVIDHSGRKC